MSPVELPPQRLRQVGLTGLFVLLSVFLGLFAVAAVGVASEADDRTTQLLRASLALPAVGAMFLGTWRSWSYGTVELDDQALRFTGLATTTTVPFDHLTDVGLMERSGTMYDDLTGIPVTQTVRWLVLYVDDGRQLVYLPLAMRQTGELQAMVELLSALPEGGDRRAIVRSFARQHGQPVQTRSQAWKIGLMATVVILTGGFVLLAG